jgi:glycogen synthase
MGRFSIVRRTGGLVDTIFDVDHDQSYLDLKA